MPRRPADIDGEVVFKLAALGATYVEIAAFFGVHEKTIRNRFSDEKHRGEQSGNISLRRRQWKRAMEGSDTMLVHLGKNRLGQADKQELTGGLTITHAYMEPTVPRDPRVPAEGGPGGEEV